jgi:acetyl-CoA synthetase
MNDEFAWQPTAEIADSSQMMALMNSVGANDYDGLLKWADADLPRFWDHFIDFIGFEFDRPYEQVMDISAGKPQARWCVGGMTNIVLNCIDKHRGSKTEDAVYALWEGEDGGTKKWTYRDLDRETCRLAGALTDLGLGEGDPIGIYMPMLPEAAAAFFAIAKIGGLVVPLFSGFGAEAIIARLTDCDAKACITVDITRRRGSVIDMKAILDEALVEVPTVQHVISFQTGPEQPAMQVGRDHDWATITAASEAVQETLMVEVDAPLLLVYTSGTTGKPKGTILTHCGFGVKMAADMMVSLDLRQTDRLIWMTDFGWVVGPATVYAVAYAGASMVLAEGVPDFPVPGRIWRTIQDHKVSFMGTAPTLIRSLMRAGVEDIQQYDLSSIRVVASTGEPWTEEAWDWCFEHVCAKSAPLLNWSGGTEIGGGIVSSTVVCGIKPCSFAGSMPGMTANIVDEQGNSVGDGAVGELVMEMPSIGLTRGLWKDDGRFAETYYSMFEGKWRQGDWAVRDKDGCWYVTGRSDDTLNVSGKRTGPAEIEGAIMATGRVSEVAAIGIPDPVTGTAVMCVCVAAPGEEENGDLDQTVINAVADSLGKSFRPKRLLYVHDLPKTRSLKIMRRVIRALIMGEHPGDLSSLVNPEAVEELKRKGKI